MLFHSQAFLLLFLPACLLAYYALARDRGRRAWVLIIASFAFYAYWDLRFLPLLIGSIAVNWLLAWHHQRFPGWLLATIGVGFNLGLLGVFKYADFAADSVAWLLGSEHRSWSIVLPLGVSFFTFQQISYLVDLSRGEAPRYRLRDYALYVSFFPQLIAGPIVRHDQLIFQFERSPLESDRHRRISEGLFLLTIGIFKKSVIADHLAAIADPVFAGAAGGEAIGSGLAWLGLGAFALQIYFDFSGYSDMAIGLGKLFGLELPVNFDAPYRAGSIQDFWRRWHMTLSRFLRDYLYIALGGNRHGMARQVLALAVTMLLGGLWHGAAWTFVVWGGLHGVGLAVSHLWQRLRRPLPYPLGWLITFGFVTLTWVFFRANDFTSAQTMLGALLGRGGASSADDLGGLGWLAIGLALATLGPTSQEIVRCWLAPRLLPALGVGAGLVALVVYVGGWRTQEFIYFQF